MDDQPSDRDLIIERDRVAREEGLEHTGGLGELEGAGTTGGAEAGPTPADEDLGPLGEELGEAATPPRRDHPDDPPLAERLGFGDVGRLGDPSRVDAIEAPDER